MKNSPQLTVRAPQPMCSGERRGAVPSKRGAPAKGEAGAEEIMSRRNEMRPSIPAGNRFSITPLLR
jgi:hypothetical protein